jgi:hypothetical protein
VIEQHQYMIFRYVSIDFLGSSSSSSSSSNSNDVTSPSATNATPTNTPPHPTTIAPSNWSVSAWGVNAPWEASDTYFRSSDNVLGAVWNLSANMLEKGVLDTYTDSNARERRAYECDGLIAAGNRMLLQSNTVMWARHSHSWIFQYPTWPVEWLQITPFLAHMDYMATGSTDLAEAYFDLLYNNTQIHALDHTTGLINTSKPGSRDVELWNFTGRRLARHLVGWAPAPITNNKIWMFSKSDFLSTSNFYTVRGLELLAELAHAAGMDAAYNKCTTAAANLRSSIMKHMWDSKAQRFCDGVCLDPHVGGNHSIYSDMYSLWLGIVPTASANVVFNSTVSWGMEHLGDHGMFVYMKALSAYPNVGDGGEASLAALTKCDEGSWCHQIRDYDATMTRESAYAGGGTASHAWGAATIAASVNNLVGLRQTAPAYATFEVRPRLGGLQHVEVTVPSPYGPIRVNATPGLTEVTVPCNTLASLCIATPSLGGQEQVLPTPAGTGAAALHLDGEAVSAEQIFIESRHACIHRVGCGVDGTPRRLGWAA